jgi:hypothetical protein
LLSRMKSVITRSRDMVDAQKRVIRTASKKVVRAVQEAVHVLRIAIFLHSAKDFSSVLGLYGTEGPSTTE